MNSGIAITVQHMNCLDTYLSEWLNMIRYVIDVNQSKEVDRYELIKVPTTLTSLRDNTYDLCVVLEHLDSRLQILESGTILQLDLKSYSEARVFVKAFFVLFRILLDNVSGIIKFLYDKNQPGVAITKSFSDLLKNAKSKKIHDESLSKLLEQHESWISEVTAKRDDLVHNYESILIYFDETEGGKRVLGHFNTKKSAIDGSRSIRDYLGIILCHYQAFIDGLLDHFDNKFKEWHRIDVGKSMHSKTIMQGCTALPLWWAYKYGKYSHSDLQVS